MGSSLFDVLRPVQKLYDSFFKPNDDMAGPDEKLKKDNRPKIADMVNNAIKSLDEPGGSTLRAIKKFIAMHYNVNIEKLTPVIKRYLDKSVSSGFLQQIKNTKTRGTDEPSSAASQQNEASSVDSDKWKYVEECIRVAELAFSKDNYDKAERFLRKAENEVPTVLAKRMLAEVRAKRNSENGTVEEKENVPVIAEDEEYKYRMNQKDNADQMLAKDCLALAEQAKGKGLYSKAQFYTTQSKQLYPTPEADKLSEQLSELLLKSPPNKQNKDSYRHKEVAEKNVDLAQEYFAKGNLVKAEHFLQKANNLFETYRAKDLLRQIKHAKAMEKPEAGQPVESEKPPSSTEEKQVNLKSQGLSPQHFEAIRKVNEAANDYEIFGLQNDSPKRDIEKAHRRLALLLHTDKNKAPGAQQAYLKMNHAYMRIQKP